MAPVAESPTRRRANGERERRAVERRRTARRPEPGRATLDDRVTALWRRLAEDGTAGCPVCGAEDFAAARPCVTCRSELS